MKLIEMTATFGKLDHAVLRPGPGLTLVEAPNEGGKSTWAAFLRAMLYGFPPRDRDKEGHIAEKNRYQPWSGAPMEGTLTLEWQGRSVTIRRGPRGSVPWGAFSAVWTASGEPVPGLTSETCGEALTGVSREVFERTLFLGQDGQFLSPSADLEKRIAALATSGEEDVSFSQAERRLLDWRNRRRVNARVGLIPQLEEKLRSAEDTLERQGSLMERQLAASRRREELEQEQAALEAHLRAHRSWSSVRQRLQLDRARDDLDSARERLSQAQEAVKNQPSAEALLQAQADLKYRNNLEQEWKEIEKALPLLRETSVAAKAAALSDPWFGGQDPAQAAARAQADRDRAAEPAKKPPVWMWVLSILLLCAAVGLLAAALIMGDYLFLIPVNALVILSCALVLIRTVLAAGRAKKRSAEQAALLEKYDVKTPDDILLRSSDYAQKAQKARQAETEAEEAQQKLDTLSARCKEIEGQILDLVHPFAPQVTNLFGAAAALSRALQQKDRYREALAQFQSAEKVLSALPSPAPDEGPAPAQAPDGDPAQLSARLALVTRDLAQARDEDARLRGELSSLGDPAEVQAARDALTEELSRRQEEYAAITAALESLKQADSLLRERFSPAINQKAGEYLSALTGGRYDRASLTRQFQALAQEQGSSTPRSDLTLSGGTVGQLYLAVRLAMCDLTLPQDEPAPLLLDDALDAFDDHRARLALGCLLEVAKKRQVLLFTCHSREGAMLAGTDALVIRQS